MDLVVRCLDPCVVFLFGSVAQGRARVDSDIDLLVVAEFWEPPGVRGLELRGLLERFPSRVDLHLMTPAEFDSARRRPHSFVATVQRHGRRLHPAP